MLIIFLAFLFVFLPAPAFAYLDPGTGNALMYVFFSLIGAIGYFFKNIFYRLRGTPLPSENVSGQERLVIFSEGPNYWSTYRPVVEALLRRKLPFTYLTMDFHDPALGIDSPFMKSRYIGRKSRAYHRMNTLAADILLTTTPNIDSPGYPIRKSPKIRELIHVYHAADTGEWYHKGGVDSCDTLFLPNEEAGRLAEMLAEKRSLKPKEHFITGVPCMDVLASRMPEKLPPTNGKTVLVAPSWGMRNCVSVYGLDFIRRLASAGCDIIIRPHPHSRKAEPELLEGWRSELCDIPNILWDDNIDGSASLQKADVMITALSGVSLDFALLYRRPVITLRMETPGIRDYDYDDIRSEISADHIDRDLGPVLQQSDMVHIAEIVQGLLAERKMRDYDSLRSKYLPNFGRTGDVIAEILETKLHSDIK